MRWDRQIDGHFAAQRANSGSYPGRLADRYKLQNTQVERVMDTDTQILGSLARLTVEHGMRILKTLHNSQEHLEVTFASVSIGKRFGPQFHATS